MEINGTGSDSQMRLRRMEDVPIRVDPNFRKLLDEINLQRMRAGIDRDKVSCRRLTKAIAEHNLMNIIANDLINKKRDDTKRWRR